MACHSDGIASETAGSTAERTPSCNLGDKKTCQPVVVEGKNTLLSGGFCQKCSVLTGLTDILSGRKKSRNEVELGAPAKRLWEV